MLLSNAVRYLTYPSPSGGRGFTPTLTLPRQGGGTFKVVGQSHNILVKRRVTLIAIPNSRRPENEVKNGLNLPQEVAYPANGVLGYVEDISVVQVDILTHVPFFQESVQVTSYYLGSGHVAPQYLGITQYSSLVESTCLSNCFHYGDFSPGREDTGISDLSEDEDPISGIFSYWRNQH